jgi:Protein of unknown function (DUF3501)
MSKLSRDTLFSLEQYSDMRPQFRQQVMEHKKSRRVFLGENATLYFESELTMRYQIQEMLRIEKIFDKESIQEELDTYNPLVPDGKNWKATFMIEFSDEDERKNALEKMLGIEQKVYVQIEGHDPVWAIADEDLERETEVKTSSVHFMRFELSDGMISDLRNDKALTMGIEHPAYTVQVTINDKGIRDSLMDDLH